MNTSKVTTYANTMTVVYHRHRVMMARAAALKAATCCSAALPVAHFIDKAENESLLRLAALARRDYLSAA